MTPTEKHRETAEQIANDFRMIGDGCEGDLMEMIAHALAKAEREGMKRAATHLGSIADAMWERCETHRPAELWSGPGVGEKDDAVTAWCFERAAAAILSEAGEDA